MINTDNSYISNLDWIDISQLSFFNKNELCLFCQFYKVEDGPPIIVTSYLGTIQNAIDFRKYHIENNYTHFMIVYYPLIK